MNSNGSELTTTVTTGGTSVGNITVYPTGDWQYPWWYTNQWPIYQPVIAFPTEPTHCIGKAHVFDCDHVDTCKCGRITRVLERKKKRK